MIIILEQIIIFFYKLFARKFVAKCGHETYLKDLIFIFGRKVFVGITIDNPFSTIEYCHDCLEKTAIQCAWCGEPIFAGNIITLYSPIEDFKIPNYAVRYREKTELKQPVLVGCFRQSCRSGRAFEKAGLWTAQGYTGEFRGSVKVAEKKDVRIVVIDE